NGGAARARAIKARPVDAHGHDDRPVVIDPRAYAHEVISRVGRQARDQVAPGWEPPIDEPPEWPILEMKVRSPEAVAGARCYRADANGVRTVEPDPIDGRQPLEQLSQIERHIHVPDVRQLLAQAAAPRMRREVGMLDDRLAVLDQQVDIDAAIGDTREKLAIGDRAAEDGLGREPGLHRNDAHDASMAIRPRAPAR